MEKSTIYYQMHTPKNQGGDCLTVKRIFQEQLLWTKAKQAKEDTDFQGWPDVAMKPWLKEPGVYRESVAE